MCYVTIIENPYDLCRNVWWLVRVTLVVDWLFLPRNFGLVVGIYEGLLPFCECTWGGGSICRWWGIFLKEKSENPVIRLTDNSICF